MRTKVLTLFGLCLLSGCQTASVLSSGAAGGLESMASCEQIHATFNAYQQDRQSIDALRQVAGVTDISISDVTPESVANYYPLVKESTRIALMVKGCQPLNL